MNKKELFTLLATKQIPKKTLDGIDTNYVTDDEDKFMLLLAETLSLAKESTSGDFFKTCIFIENGIVFFVLIWMLESRKATNGSQNNVIAYHVHWCTQKTDLRELNSIKFEDAWDPHSEWKSIKKQAHKLLAKSKTIFYE